MHHLGGDLFVKKSSLEYHASARYDDVIEIGMRCARIGNSSMQFLAEIYRGDTHLISGEIVYVYADPATQTSRPVPQALRDVLLGYEAGQVMTETRLGPWTELQVHARSLRTEVFLQEQNVPVYMEWDEFDAQATHAVTFNRMGVPIATGRLLREPTDAPGVARLGRMAVTRVLRGSNLGRGLLKSLIKAAQEQGWHELHIHAQRSAVGFYSQFGFMPHGDVFDEAGIPHIGMKLVLAS
jgi:GNAT superfamily N-acetyltransferase